MQELPALGREVLQDVYSGDSRKLAYYVEVFVY